MIRRYILPEMGAIWAEESRFGRWLDIELEACRAHARRGNIPPKDLKIILRKSGFSIPRIDYHEKKLQHDVLAFIASVSEKVGPSARYIHMGLTSYDVVDTSLSMAMRDSLGLIIGKTEKLAGFLKKLASANKMTVMVGRTHGVHAEPISLGLKMAVHYMEMRRSLDRLAVTKENVSYGKISGAVGNYAHLPPEIESEVLARLGLKADPISTQVIQRDRHAEYLCTLAILSGTLERLATEIRNLQRTEIQELEEPFAKGQRGSSAMPHKRNPVLCERVVGLARVVRGYASAGLENIALWHERDLTNSSAERVIIPDATIAVDYMLYLCLRVMAGLRVRKDRMRRNLDNSGGLVFSQRVMLALVKTGLTRDRAYKVVQRNAMKAFNEGLSFRELLAADPEVKGRMDRDSLGKCFDPFYYLRNSGKIFRRLGIK